MNAPSTRQGWVTYQPLRAMATATAGGRGWRAMAAGIVVVALVFMLALPLVLKLPTAVVAGIVVMLACALFFGTVQHLQRAAATTATDVCQFVVLDLRRISTIDATRAVGQARLRDSLTEKRTQLLLAGVTSGNRHGQALRAHGVLAGGGGRG